MQQPVFVPCTRLNICDIEYLLPPHSRFQINYFPHLQSAMFDYFTHSPCNRRPVRIACLMIPSRSRARGRPQWAADNCPGPEPCTGWTLGSPPCAPDWFCRLKIDHLSMTRREKPQEQKKKSTSTDKVMSALKGSATTF